MKTQLQLPNNRELWIDILRGAGILLVLLGHTSPPFKKIIYGFHMALFFCLSGYLYRQKGERLSAFIKKGLRRYIIPYFVLCAINFVLDYCVHLMVHEPFPAKNFIIGILYSRGAPEWLPNCSPLWFLTAIFMAMLLFELVQRINSAKLKVAILVGLGLCSALLSYFEVFKLPWNIDSAMMAVGFVGLGFYAKKKGVLQWLSNQILFVRIIAITALIAIGCAAIMLNPVSLVSFDSNRYGNVALMYVGALSITFVFFFLFYRIPWKGKTANYMSFFGKHTIFFMGFDSFSGLIAKSVLGRCGLTERSVNWVLEFMMKIVLLTVACIVYNFIIKQIKNEPIKNALSF